MSERMIKAVMKNGEMYYCGRDLQLELQDMAEEYSGEIAMALSGVAIGMGMRIKKDMVSLKEVV